MHLLQGGAGSGNYGHRGRPGEVGGSSKFDFSSEKKVFDEGLNENQKDSLHYYGNKSNYVFLNNYLRGKVNHSGEGFDEIIHNIETSMKPITSETIVYRGIKSSPRKFKVGDTFIDKAFVSTSVKEWNANMYRRRSVQEREPKGGTLFRIKVPKGYPVAYLNFYNDQEILLPRNTKFRVISNVNSMVELEIIN